MPPAALPLVVRRLVYLVLIAASVALAGCGGGGGSGHVVNGGEGDEPPDPPPAPPAPVSSRLVALEISSGTLSPGFSPDTLGYVVGPALLPGSVTLTPTTEDPVAVVSVQGALVASGTESPPVALPAGTTFVDVTVTSPTTTHTYTVVFQRGGPALQDAYVKASNTEGGDGFGVAVAADGDTLVVGAPGEGSAATGVDGGVAAEADNGAAWSGAAYVYARVGGVWTRQAYLKASNTGYNDSFGCSVAVSGDTIVVGACRESSNATGVNAGSAAEADNSASGAGAAYVFVRSGATWSQQAYLKASNTRSSARFGVSVAISGDTIVVGSDLANNVPQGQVVASQQVVAPGTYSGAAYVFKRTGTTWIQEGYLAASVPGTSDGFGTSVAISGDTIVVGAPWEDSAFPGIDSTPGDDSAMDAGAAYVFERASGVWTQTAYVKPSVVNMTDHFGRAVAVSGGTFVVGAPEENGTARGVHPIVVDPGGTCISSGAVYVFERAGASWAQTAYVKASNRDVMANFGDAVALSGDTLLVGAHHESSTGMGFVLGAPEGSDFNAQVSGAAYLFLRSGGAFAQSAYIKSSNAEGGDMFGTCVAIGGGGLAIGARLEDSGAIGIDAGPTAEADNSAPGAGAVYLLR